MTQEQKQQFEHWLIHNLQLTSKSNVELVVDHVARYFCRKPESNSPVQQAEGGEAERRIKELSMICWKLCRALNRYKGKKSHTDTVLIESVTEYLSKNFNPSDIIRTASQPPAEAEIATMASEHRLMQRTLMNITGLGFDANIKDLCTAVKPPAEEGKSMEEVLNNEISADWQRMLLEDTFLVRQHNGIEYRLINERVALAAMSTYTASLTRQNEELRRALEGVIRVADRKTDEFDRAKQALSQTTRTTTSCKK